jgi:uncharacterized protein YkwD
VYADGTQGVGGSVAGGRPSFARRRASLSAWSLIARGCVALLVVGLLWGLAASSAQGEGPPEFMDGPEYQVLVRINNFRAQHGLGALRPNRALTGAADAHSRDMVRRRYYAHDTLNGRSWNRRIKRYVRASTVGETLDLLYGPRGGKSDASVVVSDWIHSPAHRAVLLTPRLHRIGVARAARRHGRPAVFTADFAN